MGWHYRRSYETVLVAMKPGAPCKWYDTTDKIENIIRPGDYGIKKIIPSKTDHPTPKSVELAMHFIKLHTQEGDTVLDPFMGGGSTGVSCRKLGRKFIGIELDPHWYEYSKKRLESMQQGLFNHSEIQ
jgi:DNA modification methylase